MKNALFTSFLFFSTISLAAETPDVPGSEHAALQKKVGTYDVVQKGFVSPGAEPIVSQGVAVISNVAGGRFIREEYSGSMFGEPYESVQLTGYNNAKRQYESTWIYTLGTGQLFLSGTSLDGGKTIVLTGTFVDMSGEEKAMNVKLTQTDDDNLKSELFGKDEQGNDFVVIELSYTRRK